MISSFHVSCEIFMQIVREEKYLKDTEHYKKFYHNNSPQGPAKLHATKTFHIKRNKSFSELVYFKEGNFEEKQAGAHIEGVRVLAGSVCKIYGFFRLDMLPDSS
jgi:hypothetical protein